MAATVSADARRLFLEPVGEIRLEPVAPFGANAQIAAGLAVDPAVQADPVVDLVRPLAIPGHILAEMAVGLGGVITEAPQYIDPQFFFFTILGMRLE